MNKLKKSIFNPIASGINPKTVVIAPIFKPTCVPKAVNAAITATAIKPPATAYSISPAPKPAP